MSAAKSGGASAAWVRRHSDPSSPSYLRARMRDDYVSVYELALRLSTSLADPSLAADADAEPLGLG